MPNSSGEEVLQMRPERDQQLRLALAIQRRRIRAGRGEARARARRPPRADARRTARRCAPRRRPSTDRRRRGRAGAAAWVGGRVASNRGVAVASNRLRCPDRLPTARAKRLILPSTAGSRRERCRFRRPGERMSVSPQPAQRQTGWRIWPERSCLPIAMTIPISGSTAHARRALGAPPEDNGASGRRVERS